MNRKPLAETISLIVKAAAPVAAAATSLAAPLAQAASGDLDPAFADHGRLASILAAEGAVYSLEAQEGGGVFIAGGDFDYARFCYFWYECDFVSSSFTDLVSEDGSIDHSYHGLAIDGIEAYGFARQEDGKIVAAGRRVNSSSGDPELVAFRLADDGSLDAAFGENGIFELSAAPESTTHQARSLVIDPEGRIVVAGARNVVVGTHLEGQLVVLRLLQDGQLDSSFGAAGVYAGPAADFYGDIRIVRTPDGTYRVASAGAQGCAIVGLDANGALDAAFGDAGSAAVVSGSGDPVTCDSLEALADGKLLLAGSAAGLGYAARLLANGAPDPAFVADAAIADSMAEVTSIRSTADGKVLVAGSGIKGASIMRLQATGGLDALFGDGGRTWIDLPAAFGSAPIVHDIAARSDGSVIAAGGDLMADKPFVVRLVGDAGSASAGIASLTDSYADAQESDGKAIVHVRRSGGSDGDVSVAYHTVADAEAIADSDFTTASGTIHWADGDSSEREIAVDIAQDDGPAEGFESFHLALDPAEGGAGLGAQYATVTIQPDGSPWGQIEIGSAEDRVAELGVAEIWVYRNYYSQGEVSVTVTVDGITATADEDFTAEPVTLTWGPDDSDAKPVLIQIVDDSAQEDGETFRVTLSNPTGGALLGVNTSQVIQIVANDAPPPPHRPHGGGGAAGFLSLLLLGLAEVFRAVRRHLRNRA